MNIRKSYDEVVSYNGEVPLEEIEDKCDKLEGDDFFGGHYREVCLEHLASIKTGIVNKTERDGAYYSRIK